MKKKKALFLFESEDQLSEYHRVLSELQEKGVELTTRIATNHEGVADAVHSAWTDFYRLKLDTLFLSEKFTHLGTKTINTGLVLSPTMTSDDMLEMIIAPMEAIPVMTAVSKT